MILGAVNHSEYGDFKCSLQLHTSAQVGSSTYKTSGIPQLNVTTPGPELHKRDPDGLVQSLSPENVRMLTHFLPEVRVY